MALSLAREKQRRRSRRRLTRYQPYSKQAEFHAAGALHRERLFMAGNQLGKTLAGAMEWAMHLTGRYPDWWEGRRFTQGVRLWAAGETRISTRDTVQRLLLGPPEQEEEWGTGTIPGDAIRVSNGIRRATGVPNGVDSLMVKHASGYTSTLLFKCYEQGRSAWQGETLHGVWFDEEPPMDVYMEGLTRTNATDGIVMVTFTPLRGMSDVVRMFLEEEALAKS
jgi:phage terminase large subunit-like protein